MADCTTKNEKSAPFSKNEHFFSQGLSSKIWLLRETFFLIFGQGG